MNSHDILASTIGTGSSVRAVEKPRLDGAPVLATAMLSDVPPVYGSGNIGHLAVNIIANRLLAAGAEPRYISATAIISPDTDVNIIRGVAEGLRDAAVDAEMDWTAAESVTAPAGSAPAITLSAFGIGKKMVNVTSKFDCPRPGDAIIVTGPIAAAGAAIEGYRRGLDVLTLADGTVLIDVMRAVYVQDPDLSGVIYPIAGISAALAELGAAADIDRTKLPITDIIATACSQLGIDPLEAMTADAMLLTVAPRDVERVIEAVRRYPAGQYAAVIGHVK